MEETTAINSVVAAWTNKILGLYFTQIITLVVLLFLIFSGKLSKFFNWITSFRKVKVGNKVELEGGETVDDRRHDKRRKDDREQETSINISLNSLANDISEMRKDVDSKFEEVLTTIETHEALLGKVSRGVLEDHVFNDTIAPFRRLKAFRRGIALRINKRFKEKGLKIILQNKETWLDVLDTPLDVEIVDKAYYNSVMNEIELRIYGGVF